LKKLASTTLLTPILIDWQTPAVQLLLLGELDGHFFGEIKRMHPHAVDAPQQQKKSSTRNPKYNAAIRCHHLLRKAFQTLGQHLWMQSETSRS
jgi:hypothetical protein